MQTYKARIVGDAPLLMHSVRLLDKTSEISKEFSRATAKKKKTEDDLLVLKRLEWFAGIYTDENGVVSIPADNIMATVIGGARKSKLGKQAEAAVFTIEAYFPLIYQGPSDLKELYECGKFCDYRAVKNQRNGVMRSRPIFRSWKCDIALSFDESILERGQLEQAIKIAGEQIGIGDWRPRHGRFHVEA